VGGAGTGAEAGTGATGGAQSGGGTGGSGATGGSGGTETGGAAGQGAGGTGGDQGGGGCAFVPGGDDFTRKIVVAHNRGPGGVESNVYEVLELSESGQISRPGVTFEMGSGEGEIVFTTGGAIGIAIQGQGKDRSLGVFRFDDNGDLFVVNPAIHPSFYPHKIIIPPGNNGDAYVLDAEWVEHGGGVYKISFGCEGQYYEMGKVLDAKLPNTMLLLDDDRVFLSSTDVLGSDPSMEAHLIDLLSPPVRVASAEAFGDDDAIIVSAARTEDGKYVLLGDDSMFGGERVGVVRIDGDSLSYVQTIPSVPAPVSIVPSPNNDVVLVVSEYPDDIHVLNYDPSNSSKPFSLRGKLAYVGQKPSLPSTAVMIERGSLKGHVLVADLYGIRQIQFTAGGQGVKDLGLYKLGESFPDTISALGIQK
jgi:hypothetical protein